MRKHPRRDWRTLKAAREGRLLKRERLRREQLQADIRQARYEAAQAREAPLARIKARAVEYLAGCVAEALGKARNEFTRNALAEIDRHGIAKAILSAREDIGGAEATHVFSITIPEAAWHFRTNLRRLAEEAP